MVKTIRLSEAYYAWLYAHNQDNETMEETLRRLIRGPNPEDVAGLLTEDEVEEAKGAVKDLRNRDGSRFEAAREAFEDEGADE
jgi:hypothetical protein